MNLNSMNREELTNQLKKFMWLCTNNFTIERVDWSTGDKVSVNFNKGEHYFVDSNEGGMWILADNGEWFDVCDDRYSEMIEKNFRSERVGL